MKTLQKLILLTLFVSTFHSCSDSDDGKIEIKTNTVVDLALANTDLTILVEALTKADLVSTLAGNGPFTVLAPTNAAFAKFLDDNNFAQLSDVPDALLKQVLMNHVISGKLASTDLSTGYANTLATSDAGNKPMSIFINTADGVVFNGVSKVTIPNVSADNGIVHVVDQVIVLPTVVTFATADPNFSTLVTALTRDDLMTDFVSVLSTSNGTSPAPFTVFAPINSAFSALLTELEANSLSDITEPTLRATLNHHVIGGNNYFDTDLADNLSLTTLGGAVTANVTGGASITDANERKSGIIATNVQANNGIIHAINKVILPPL